MLCNDVNGSRKVIYENLIPLITKTFNKGRLKSKSRTQALPKLFYFLSPPFPPK